MYLTMCSTRVTSDGFDKTTFLECNYYTCTFVHMHVPGTGHMHTLMYPVVCSMHISINMLTF